VRVLEGAGATGQELDELVAATERKVPFSYSDLIHRITEPALRLAVRSDQPFCIEFMMTVAERAEPTPLIEDTAPPT
jgi:hypothetical protein